MIPVGSRWLHRGAVLMLIAGLVLVGCGDDRPDSYSAETRAAMLSGCIEDDTDRDLIQVCECTYDQARKTINFSDFADLERRLAGGDNRLPASLVNIVRDCIREVSLSRT